MTKKIFIAGGGTGGHIYPALAIARGLLENNPELKIHFVGSPQGLETRIIPEQGFPIHLIPIGRLNRNVHLFERIKTLLGLPFSLFVSLYFLLRYRPSLLLGVGGFASAPVLFVGALFRFKIVIWESNAYPGLANRWLSKFVSYGLVVFDEAKEILKMKRMRRIGIPVRKEIELLDKKGSSLGKSFKILVFGGSQGARGINFAVCEAICRGGDWLDDVEIIHQTGRLDFPQMLKKYNKAQFKVDVREYLSAIHEQYDWADLVLCRAGASTIAELAAAQKPAVLVPFPFAADNHQQRNAEVLVKKEAAKMVLQNDFTADKFIQMVNKFKKNRMELDILSKNIRSFHRPNAANEIAQLLLAEINGDHSL